VGVGAKAGAGVGLDASVNTNANANAQAETDRRASDIKRDQQQLQEKTMAKTKASSQAVIRGAPSAGVGASSSTSMGAEGSATSR
jgi:hypothetical protein